MLAAEEISSSTANCGNDIYQLQVPGSVANLGPGFDTLGVAVELYLKLRAQILPGQNELHFEFDCNRPQGENYIERAFRYLARKQGSRFPSLRIHCESDIPQKAGIGSSAAATIAGLRLYSMVNGPLSRRELLESACALEGHPDNAAAALFGGLTASCKLDDCSVASVNLRWPESLCLVVLTPKLTLSTSTARNVLPPEVSRVDAVFNLQRMALLIYALENADFRLLHEAARDRLHQPQRQALVPGLDAMLKIQHPDILGVCLSGSGPSIVALAHQNFGEVERELASSFEPFQVPFQIRTLRVHKQGAHVS